MAAPIEVRTRMDKEGNLVPLDCILGDKKYQVLGIGRRWQAEDGEHIMVMFPGDRAVELLHHSDGIWLFIKDHSAKKDRFV